MHIFNWGARKEKRQIPLGPLCAAHQTLGSDFPFLLLLQFVLTVGTAEAGHTHRPEHKSALQLGQGAHRPEHMPFQIEFPNTCEKECQRIWQK